MKHRRVLVPVMLGALALAGCGKKEAEVQAKNEPEPGMGTSAVPATSPGRVALPANSPKLQQIKVRPVETAVVPVAEVIAPGKIEANPNRLSHVVLPLSGRVVTVLVHLGDAVRQGQPLLLMEAPDADAAMSGYLQAQAGVTTAKSAMLKAKADADRSHDLEAHEAIAKKDVLNADATLQQSQAALEQAQAVEKQAARRLEVLGLKPGEFGQKLTVRAPIAGKITEINVAPGEFRNDTNASVVTIADLSSVWVSSDVPETQIRMIEKGEHLEVSLEAYPGQVFRARVTRIADAVDPTTRTVKVSAELPNPGEKLRPEMYGKIRHVDQTKELPVVPAAAVVQGDGKNSVYREVSPGVFQQTPVTLGNHIGDQVAVVSGLQPGQRIVTDGVMLLQSNL